MNQLAKSFDEIVIKRRAYRVFDTKLGIPDEVVKRSLERAILAPSSSNMQLWEFYRIKTKENLKIAGEICLSQSGATTAPEIVVFVSRSDLWQKRINTHLERIQKSSLETNQSHDKNRLFSGGETTYYKKLMPSFYNPSFPCIKNIFKRIYVWIKGRKKPFMQDVTSKYIDIVAHKSCALAAQTFMLSISAEGYDSLPMEGLDSKRMKKLLNLPKTAEINMAISVGKGLPEGIRGERFRLDYDEVVFQK